MDTIDSIIDAVDQRWRTAFNAPLSDLQKTLLRGCLQQKTDQDIASENHLSTNTIKLAAADLWARLSEVLSISIDPINCRDVLVSYFSASRGPAIEQQVSPPTLAPPALAPPSLDPPAPFPSRLEPSAPFLPPETALEEDNLPYLPEPEEDLVFEPERLSAGAEPTPDLLKTELYAGRFVREGLQVSSQEPMRSITLTDVVDCSVFGPDAIALNDLFLIQVFVHLPDQFDQAQQRALMADPDAQARAVKTLAIEIKRDSQLTFELIIPGLTVGTPVQHLIWRGAPTSVEFEVTTPASLPYGNAIGTVIVSQNSVPIGQLKFKLAVGKPSQETIPVSHAARRYSKAFVSYSSQDRLEVLKRVQALLLAGIDVFQDVLDLEPGDRWEQKLYRQIDQADVFLLFWSTAAKNSEWVIKEALYALACQGSNSEQIPEIIPVILEGPPTIPPPPELKHLHFQDRLAYIMAACR